MSKGKNPARLAGRHGARKSAEEFAEARNPGENFSTPASPVLSKILRIAPHSKPSHVVVTVEGYAPIVVAAKKLKSQARFQAVCLYRFKIAMVFEGDWSTIVAEARRNGGAT